MPRFAVLTHDWPTLHWDLLLEQGDVCRTWRLSAPPDTEGPIVAEPIADHRPFYLDYEGLVSGDRGRVTRWDAGEFVMLAESPDELRLRFDGTRLAGIAAVLRRETPDRWCFRLEPT